MNYLLEIGINKDVLNEVIRHNGEAISVSFECNKENVVNIINFFKQIGIKNIAELLIYEVDVFLEDFEFIRSKINNDAVDFINDDFTCIENYLI